MTAAKRRKIKQLRALAASTTFPEEAKSATAKADQLEAALPKAEPRDQVISDFYIGLQAQFASQLNMEEVFRAYMRAAMDNEL